MMSTSTVNLQLKYTEEEVVSALRWYLTHSPAARSSFFISLIFILLGLFSLVLGVDSFFPTLCLTVGGLYLTMLATGYVKTTRQRFHGDFRFQDEHHIEFSEEGIHIQTARLDSRHDWSLYTRYVESPRFYLLVYGKHMVTIIPKRAFNGLAQQAAFVDLLQRKLPTGLRAERLVQTGPQMPVKLDQWEGAPREYVPPAEPPDWR